MKNVVCRLQFLVKVALLNSAPTKMHGLYFFWCVMLYFGVYRDGMCTEIASCEELGSPKYGTVNQTVDTAWFNCSDGYTLYGPEVIHCNTSTHKWSEETSPNCSKDETRNPSGVKTQESFQHLGCYNDANIYKLKVFPDIGKYDPSLTLEKCWELCSIARTAYFGVEQGNMCFCGKENRNFKIHGSSTRCNKPCAGNSNQLCGGQFAIDVFKIVYPSCEVLEAPMYGTVYQTTEIARFGCFDGYFLQGSEVIHCNTSNYKWEGDTSPICIRKEIGITNAKDLIGKIEWPFVLKPDETLTIIDPPPASSNRPAATTSENTYSKKTGRTESTTSYKGNTVRQIPPWLLSALILPSFFMVIVLVGGIYLLSKYLSLKYSKTQESIKGDIESPANHQYSPGYLRPAASVDQTSSGHLSSTESILAKRMPSEVFFRASEDEQPYEVLQTYHNCSVSQGDFRHISLFNSTFTGKPFLENGAMCHFV